MPDRGLERDQPVQRVKRGYLGRDGWGDIHVVTLYGPARAATEGRWSGGAETTRNPRNWRSKTGLEQRGMDRAATHIPAIRTIEEPGRDEHIAASPCPSHFLRRW
jgi:hypothetical protein